MFQCLRVLLTYVTKYLFRQKGCYVISRIKVVLLGTSRKHWGPTTKALGFLSKNACSITIQTDGEGSSPITKTLGKSFQKVVFLGRFEPNLHLYNLSTVWYHKVFYLQ